LRKQLNTLMSVPVTLNIEEVRKPEVDAQLISDSIANQLEKRIMFRRAMKRAMQNAMRFRCSRHQDHVRRPLEWR
jgi:small subunit ribosomal protein S3